MGGLGKHNYITKTLRIWRDERLAKEDSKLVTGFIKFYNSGFGERIAKILDVFPFLKPVARTSIRLFAKLNKISLKK